MNSPAPPVGVLRRNDGEDRSAAHRAIALSAIGLFITGGIEFVLARLTGSVGLLSDAIHNLSDMTTSAVVLLGFFVSKRAPTRRFPYGYERAEDLAGLGVALVIWASAAFAGIESYHKLVSHRPTTHIVWGIAGAAVGIVGNQVVAFYKKRVGVKIHSTTLIVDAKHSWLDAIASLGALLGLVAVHFGVRVADPIAGFVITAFIVRVGYSVTTDVLDHLMDGVEPEYLETAERAAGEIPGLTVTAVRGRWLGRSLHLDIDVALDDNTSLIQVDTLIDRVRSVVLLAIEAASSVTVNAHAIGADDPEALRP